MRTLNFKTELRLPMMSNHEFKLSIAYLLHWMKGRGCIPLEALDNRNEFIAYLKQKEGILISIRVIARMQISRKADYAEFS